MDSSCRAVTVWADRRLRVLVREHPLSASRPLRVEGGSPNTSRYLCLAISRTCSSIRNITINTSMNTRV